MPPSLRRLGPENSGNRSSSYPVEGAGRAADDFDFFSLKGKKYRTGWSWDSRKPARGLAQTTTRAVQNARPFGRSAVAPCTNHIAPPFNTTMATPVEEEKAWLRKKIDEVEEEKKEVKAELKKVEGAEKERLQERLNKLEGQLEALYTAISKLPAAHGML